MPKEADALTAEVTEILSSKEGLDRDVIKSILDDFKGLSKDADGLDVVLTKLRDCDADYLEEAMQLKKETHLDIITLLKDYSDRVRPH